MTDNQAQTTDPSLAEWVDQIADHFDAAFRAASVSERWPRIADFVKDVPKDRQALLLQELIKIDLEYRWRAGEKPEIEDYLRELARFAEPDAGLAADLLRYARDKYPLVRDQFDPAATKAVTPSGENAACCRCPHCGALISGADNQGQRTCSNCGNSFRVDTRQASRFTSGDLPRPLGKFELLEVLGQGSFGTVFKARDRDLDRLVAIKVPRAGSFATVEDEERFFREARSAAQLAHPHIVKIHEIAHEGDMPYIVSDFVLGRTLAQVFAERRLGFRESAELAAQIADALDYAHRHKVVHRDVNPRNILLQIAECRLQIEKQDRILKSEISNLQSVIPKLTDFGLARRDEGDIVVTMDGQILGTPAYMAPEQAAGELSQVDGRSDVYSLGVILYELLTGELPFRGHTRMLLHQVLHDEPRPPRRLNDRIPRDLETICLKAMAKTPARRYATAGHLAADLRRYLKGEPIQARPITTIERLWRWSRRNPGLASLTAAVIGLLLAVTGGSVFEVFRLIAARAETEANLQRTQESLSRVQASRGILLLEQQNPLGLLDLLEARKRVDKIPQARGSTSLLWSGWYAAYANRLDQVMSHQGALLNITFSPDGKLLCTASSDQTAQLWDTESGKPFGDHFQLFLKTNQTVCRVSFSRDGKLVAISSHFGREESRIWETSTGKQVDLPFSDKDPLLLDPQGNRFARLWLEKESVQFWDLSSRRAYAETSPGVGFNHFTYGYSPDGKLFATTNDNAAMLWDTETGKLRGKPMRHKSELHSLAWSRDGKQFATGSWRGILRSENPTARIWDATTGEPRTPPLEHPEDIHALAFSPDGNLLATGCYDGAARLWDTTTGKLLTQFRHQGAVFSLAFSPDGKLLATGSFDTTARLWDVATGQAYGWPMRHQGIVNQVAFNPDGNHLATGSADRTARLWKVPRSEEMVLKAQDRVWSVAFHPEGNFLAAGSEDGLTHNWDTRTGKQIGKPLQQPPESLGQVSPVVSLAFSPNGESLVTLGDTIQVWLAETWRPRGRPLFHPSTRRAVAFSPDGELFASGGNGTIGGDGIQLWDALTGNPLGEALPEKGAVYHLAFSCDGRLLTGGSWAEGFVQLWDVKTRQPHGQPLAHGNPVEALAFSPDGQLLATASRDLTIRFWDPETCQATGQRFQQHSIVQDLAFHPNGKLLAAGYSDGTVRLLELTTGLPCGPAMRHEQFVTSVAFNKKGTLLASGSFDRTARIWKVPQWFDDLHEMELRTWVALGARLNEQGTVEPIPWQEWQELRQELQALERKRMKDEG